MLRYPRHTLRVTFEQWFFLSFLVDYDVPPERANASKTHTPLLSTFRPEQHFPKEIPTHVDPSMPSYDYIRDLRRCILEIDREKGLGFILSATGDYDHTITSVDKVCLRKTSPEDLCLICSR